MGMFMPLRLMVALTRCALELRSRVGSNALGIHVPDQPPRLIVAPGV
jgi:hypothetical protein